MVLTLGTERWAQRSSQPWQVSPSQSDHCQGPASRRCPSAMDSPSDLSNYGTCQACLPACLHTVRAALARAFSVVHEPLDPMATRRFPRIPIPTLFPIRKRYPTNPWPRSFFLSPTTITLVLCISLAVCACVCPNSRSLHPNQYMFIIMAMSALMSVL